ncbi:hypothetical protein EDD86DRAFT_84448 [Gorgonomyces haynaldii]|nr:hypothetical protein EDD86DRAFT_84448 [Gorgonomyces haynaldii]
MRKMHDNVGWRIVHNEIVAGASFNEAPKILHMNPSVMHLLSDFYPQSMHTQPTNQDRLALKALSSQGSFYTHTPPTSCYHQSFACLMLILSSVMHLRKTHPDGSAHYLLGEASIEYALDDWQPILRRMRPGVTISTQARLLMLEYAYWGVKMFLFMPSFVRTFNDSCVIKRRAFVKCIDATSKLIRSLRFMTTELNIHFARFPTYAYFLLSNAGLVACAVLRNNLHRNLTWQAAKDLSYIVTILESYTETDTVMRPFLRVLHLKMDEYKLDRKWYRDPDATPRTPKCIVTM